MAEGNSNCLGHAPLYKLVLALNFTFLSFRNHVLLLPCTWYQLSSDSFCAEFSIYSIVFAALNIFDRTKLVISLGIVQNSYKMETFDWHWQEQVLTKTKISLSQFNISQHLHFSTAKVNYKVESCRYMAWKGNWIYNAQHCCKAFKLYCVSLLKQLSV